jgi:hemerythrin
MKSKIEWDSALALGNISIDNDHKTLIDILNRAITLYNEDINHPNLFKVIFHLMHYANVHFNKEEQFFTNLELDVVKNHLKEHANFKEKVMKINMLINNKDSVRVDYLELIVFLETWLVHHIKESDQILKTHGIIPVTVE